MTQFNDREKTFENKLKLDKELDFKVQARRNKLLGQWAATQLGLDAASAKIYAKEVVMSDFDEPGDEDVLRKVHEDLKGKGVETSEHLIRKEMDRLLLVARDQVMTETK
ncbi:MAG: DUF1476 domain-containing protein [Proteobacteria bacterium]|nr:DUF1476 domain-containing protein [Pseudomonadota bacterium]